MGNKKGFTLVELLAVIVILAVIILIAVNAVLPQMRKARRNSFADEVINFAKAAETKYVADSLSATGTNGNAEVCYNISQLKGTYVAKNDDKYTGTVKLTINGDTITKSVTMNNGEFYVSAADPSDLDADTDVKDYTSSAWTGLETTKVCP